MSEIPFTEMVPGMRVANASDDEMYVIFGDPDQPKHVELIGRMDALKAGISLAAASSGKPVFSYSLISAARMGATITNPPLRVRVMVFDDESGETFTAHVHALTEMGTVLVAIGIGDDGEPMLKEVKPLQILRLHVLR